MNNKTRIDYIDMIKAIGIILVIFGHINEYNMSVKSFIYSFHMPLFFAVCGMVSTSRNYKKGSLKNILFKKFKSIIIPYFLWAMIYVELTPKNLLAIGYGSHQSLMQNNTNLWYLPCFFLSVILYELIKFIIFKVKKYTKFEDLVYLALIFLCIITSILLPELAYGYPFSINISFMGLAFILIGRLINKVISNFNIYELKVSKLLIIFLVLFIGIFTYKFNSINYVYMAENNYGNVLLFIFTALLGIMATIILAIILDKISSNVIKKWILFIGKNTLVIFASQILIISLLQKIFVHLNLPLPSYIIMSLIAIIIVLFYTFIIKLVNMFIPVLNGKVDNSLT